MKPRILILSFSAILSDPRVMRQVRLLEDRATLTVAGYGTAPEAECEFIAVPHKLATLANKGLWALTLLLTRFERYYWNRPEVQAARSLINGREFDLVIANDNAVLPLALLLARGKPVLADAHEYSPREFDDKLLWRLVFGRYQNYLCRVYLPRAAAMSTVCQGIADAYRDNYGVTPSVVMNAPSYQAFEPSPVEAGKVRMIHHGAAIRSRHLEVLIDVMKHLDNRFSLDLMLMESDVAYMRHLRERAANDPRIRFVPPVRMEDICSHINSYDLGIYLLPPVNFNHEHALPNKLFEYIQARLAVAIGPSPEMARIVRRHGLGVVASSFDPSDLAAELTRLTDEGLLIYKQAAHEAARELCYEGSSQILLDQISGLLGAAKPTSI
jgi:hypothetical protein